jgi:RNA polymerase sigma-70 factor (ECF subfamily)
LHEAFVAHGTELFGFARKALNDPGAAEEVVQETFVRAWRARHRFDPNLGTIRTWLFAIERNVVIDHARARAIRRTEPLRDDLANDVDDLEGAMVGWQVEEAVRRLREEHRQVLLETYYRGRSSRDVAAKFGIPEGTVRSRLFLRAPFDAPDARRDGVGTLSSHDCDHFKGLIALEALGKLPDAEHLGLASHVNECRDCRRDERDLSELSAVLPAADLGDLGDLGEEEMPSGLPGKVLGRLHLEARRDRRVRGLRYVLGGAVAAAVVAFALVLSLDGNTSPESSLTVTLTGEPGVHASLRLTREAWGTALHLEESGQPEGRVLWVSMQTTSGKWWGAGTYRTVAGRSVQVDLACALKLSDIERVWVRDSAGDVLLRAYVS